MVFAAVKMKKGDQNLNVREVNNFYLFTKSDKVNLNRRKIAEGYIVKEKDGTMSIVEYSGSTVSYTDYETPRGLNVYVLSRVMLDYANGKIDKVSIDAIKHKISYLGRLKKYVAGTERIENILETHLGDISKLRPVIPHILKFEIDKDSGKISVQSDGSVVIKFENDDYIETDADTYVRYQNSQVIVEQKLEKGNVVVYNVREWHPIFSSDQEFDEIGLRNKLTKTPKYLFMEIVEEFIGVD